MDSQSPPPQTPGLGEADRRALSKLKLFSIVFLVVIAGSFVIGFGTDLIVLVSAFRGGTTGAATSSSSFQGIIVGALVVSVVLGAVEFLGLVQLRSAFKSLSEADASSFAMPTKFTTLILLSLPLAIVAVVLILGGLSTLASTTGTTTITNSEMMSSGDFYSVIGGGILALIAAIVTIVGIIGGPILGLWRVGERYDADTIKAAAIIFIIPVVQLAAPILVLVGVNNISMNLQATGKAHG